MSQVERGLYPIDKLSVIHSIARVLNIEIADLTTYPVGPPANSPLLPNELEEVRSAFQQYNHILNIEPKRTLSLPQISASTAMVHRAYQAAEYTKAASLLPDLLVNVEEYRRQRSNSDQTQQFLPHYVTTLCVAAKLATKLRVNDVALLSADRAASAAAESDSDTAHAMAGYQVVCALLRVNRTSEAEHVAVSLVDRMRQRSLQEKPKLLSLVGALWLISAVIAARRADLNEAEDRLRRASRLAEDLGEDGNHAWTAFGPTNVAIHRISVASALGRLSTATQTASSIQLDRLPEGLKSRRAQVNIDLASAYFLHRRDPDATFALLEINRETPEIIRHNTAIHDLIRRMLPRARGSHVHALTDLARCAGVID